MEVYLEQPPVGRKRRKREGVGCCLPFPSPQSTTAVSLRLFPFAPTTEPGPWLVEANFLA